MREDDRSAGLLVLLTVGCGITLQLLLVRQAAMLIHLTAAFPILAAHIAGWGIGLALGAAVRSRPYSAAILAAAAGSVAWMGTTASTGSGLLLAGNLGLLGLAGTGLASGILSGLAIAHALAACSNPTTALAADLAGVGLGALSHVLINVQAPTISAPLLWIGLLALFMLRTSPSAAVVSVLAGAVLVIPLDHPERLAEAATPLGAALRERGVEAFRGSFYDTDGRVDAVANAAHDATELFINGGTQAQTPSALPDRVTTAVLELVRPDSALVIGAGGLADVATLLEAGAQRVVAVERSRAVLAGARATSAAADDLFEDPRVQVVQAEARRFAAGSRESFDLILLPLAYGSAGVSPAALFFFPSYLFTIEGISTLGELTTPRGAVCFVLPAAVLRDRILATLGELERRRGSIGSLASRLWVVTRDKQSGYAEGVCWAPHEPLTSASFTPGLTILHDPGKPPASELMRRLRGIETLPPVEDWRPYFFDLSSPRAGLGEVPAHLSQLFIWTPLGLGLLVAVFVYPRQRSSERPRPGNQEIAIAALTGLAFPALEYAVLSIARGAGFSEGNAYAITGLLFAAAGLVAMAPRATVAQRSLLGTVCMLFAAAFFRLGGISSLLKLTPGAALVCGVFLMALVMTAGVASFAGLFRLARADHFGSTDTRFLFMASALGTLTATAPVLFLELRLGSFGCALGAALAYAAVFALSGYGSTPEQPDR